MSNRVVVPDNCVWWFDHQELKRMQRTGSRRRPMFSRPSRVPFTSSGTVPQQIGQTIECKGTEIAIRTSLIKNVGE